MSDPAARAALIEAMAFAISYSDISSPGWSTRAATAALAAIEAHAGGCCVVPKKQTCWMLVECLIAQAQAHAQNVTRGDCIQAIHNAAIAASPYAPPQQEDKA